MTIREVEYIFSRHSDDKRRFHRAPLKILLHGPN